MRILFVDDEPKIVAIARDYLEASNFEVLSAIDGTTALAMARQDNPDLIVLDLNLPDLDGIELCRSLRQKSDVPIIMLTARVDEVDRLLGLEVGADDYIVKPFSPRELVARVRTVLRRVQGNVQTSGVLRVKNLEIDMNGYTVRQDGQRIEMTRSEFELLATMAEKPGQIFTREQLLTRLHGFSTQSYERSIDAHIKNIRQKLDGEVILTVYGVGYKFTDEI